MSENKYNRVTTVVDGVEVDRSKVVLVPKPNSDGVFKTSDGCLYVRESNGQIRKIR